MIGPGLRAYLTACMDRMAEARMDLVSIEVSHGTLKVTARRGMLTVYWAEPIGIIEKVSLPGQLAAHCVRMADREMTRAVPLP